jgi:hypothetical protein
MADKKQVPLRLSEKLYNEIAAWADDDFRSVNGQIEYLLTQCVKQRRKDGKYASADFLSRSDHTAFRGSKGNEEG